MEQPGALALQIVRDLYMPRAATALTSSLHMSKTRVPDVVVFKKGDGRRYRCYQRVDEVEIANLVIA